MEYTLKRSKRKTLALQVTRELEVVVRAPQRMARRDIDAFVAGHLDWIAAGKARVSGYLAAHPEPTAEELEALRAKAKAVIPGRVAFFAERMGLWPTGIRITSARTRFGSCSGRNSLSFSCRLMAYPAEAVDYVVVHELAHIAHKNHGPQFYALVADVLPDFNVRRAMLRQ